MAYSLDSQQKVWILSKFGFLNKSKIWDLFRHSLASNMLKNNVSMPVIGTVLGHQRTETTKIYLKVDIGKLALCPLPMPALATSHYKGVTLG